MVVVVTLFARDIAVAICLMSLVTFVTHESRAAHERGVRGE